VTALTFNQVLAAVNEQHPCAKTTLINHLQKLKIEPVGKERPQRYASDTPAKVLRALNSRIVTMRQLHAVKRRALEGRFA
jgi:hypothetical protein